MRSPLQMSLTLGLAAFLGALLLVMIDCRNAFHWLLVGGTFSNLVIGQTAMRLLRRSG